MVMAIGALLVELVIAYFIFALVGGLCCEVISFLIKLFKKVD